MIRERLAKSYARVKAAAIAAGRDPESVRLVAVSKKHPPEAIMEAYAAGQRVFGENYAQELAEKAQALQDLPDIEWHFIGHLQTNKAKIVAEFAHAVHTVDCVSLARELARRRGLLEKGPLPVLIEVNVSGEPQKHGATPGELESVIAGVKGYPLLELRGLMTMPPFGDLERARSTFETLVSLRNLHGGAKELPELSMGMSDDLEVAIRAGATLVRVGTAIFGSR